MTPSQHALYDTVTNALALGGGVVCCAVFVLWVRREPRRISCAILLVLAIYLSVTGGLGLIWPNLPLENGDLAIGAGDEAMAALLFVFMIISFFGGILLCINGARLLKREGVSLGHALPLGFGAVAILWPFVFVAGIFTARFSSVAVFIYGLMILCVLYVPGMLAAVLLYSFVYAALQKPKKCDYIIVLGAGLKDGLTVTPLLARRLDRAIRLYDKGNQSALFVVSGGKGSDERVSEAEAMRQYLVKCGVPDEKIITEDRSTTTAENLRFSKNIMDARGEGYASMLVTSNYHVLRAVILAKNCGLNAHGVGARTALYYLPAAFIREYIAVIFVYKKLALIYVAIAVIWRIISLII